MKSRRLILHAGPHKTGTSSIQAVLRDHSFEAFYYPKTGQWPDGSHHNLVFSLIPELRRADAEFLEPAELLLRLQNELTEISHDSLLISSEFLSTGCAKRVLDWFVSQGIADRDDLHALVIARDPLSRAASLYNQAVKDPYIGETRTPDQWLEDEATSLSLEPMLADLRAAGSIVDVVAYEPAETLVQRVLMSAGARAEEVPDAIPWTNMSMSEEVLMELVQINRATTDPAERQSQRCRLVKQIRPAFRSSSTKIFTETAIYQFLLNIK